VGDFGDAAGFVKCASTLHAELLRAEMEHHRRRKWTNGGAMFWMFNDCWPCASWSVIDYYLLPKPAYYGAKRAAAPILAAWIEEEDRYDLHVVNDTLKPLACLMTLGQGHVVGKGRWIRKRRIQVDANASKLVATIRKRNVWREDNSFLFASLTLGARTIASTQFFHSPWREMEWPDPGLTYRVSKSRRVSVPGPPGGRHEYITMVTIKTRNYARMVHLDGVEGPGSYLSDNFFDLRPGESKTLEIRSDRAVTASRIRVRNWLDRWD
jgi:beta-mannosidase